ncbi:aminotransferase class I/II-fold pyridoxal phosphate-dependent enzyme [Candidatus Gottesmanbacteria bacterium]|nr:aminotransferase class I/II-fold pyridoxal phosphate-dependent enzyme [Candidatus Gottesmanbacteria bacterium]
MFEFPIAIGLSPNTQTDDIWQALNALFMPWSWKEGSSVEKAEKWFKDYFGVSDAVSFNSGRSALYALLKIFNIGRGDEVILQAFTCVAVPDPVIWTGAKPIFVDIEETLNIDPGLLEKHINKKTKAIIVQHTFGIPAKIEMIAKIAQKYNLILIEDCAHCIGATYKDKKIGTFGDAAFFSFGRDKVISSVFGGMAIINGKFNPSTSLRTRMENGKLREFQQKLNYPSYFWILQQLLHPIAFAIILPLYNIYLGKLILFLLQKLNLLSFPLFPEEKLGNKPDIFPLKYPNALAQLVLVQLEKLDKYNLFRRETAAYYFRQLKEFPNIQLPAREKGAIYLRFNILIKNAEELLKIARKKGLVLGNWYKNIIDPRGVLYGKIGYKKGSCPSAEKTAGLSVNLPTYPRLTMIDLKRIVDLIPVRHS